MLLGNARGEPRRPKPTTAHQHHLAAPLRDTKKCRETQGRRPATKGVRTTSHPHKKYHSRARTGGLVEHPIQARLLPLWTKTKAHSFRWSIHMQTSTPGKVPRIRPVCKYRLQNQVVFTTALQPLQPLKRLGPFPWWQ